MDICNNNKSNNNNTNKNNYLEGLHDICHLFDWGEVSFGGGEPLVVHSQQAVKRLDSKIDR